MIIRVVNLPSDDRDPIYLPELGKGELAVIVHVASEQECDGNPDRLASTSGEVVMRGEDGLISTLGDPEFYWCEDAGHVAVRLQPSDDIVLAGG